MVIARIMASKLLILFCFFILITGCSISKTDNAKENATDDFDIEEEEILTDDLSSSEELYASDDYNIIPDFLNGYIDYGTYKSPTRIPNADNFDIVKISSDSLLNFPESSILAVIVNKWGEPISLLPQDDNVIKHLVNLLQDTAVKDMAQDSGDVGDNQDTEIAVVALTANADYILIRLESFKDDSVEIFVEQENEENSHSLILSAKDKVLHDYMREICDVEEGSLKLLTDASEIKYLSRSGEWTSLSGEQIRAVKELADCMLPIKNYSSGCSFDLKVTFVVGEEEHNAVISTDSCGVLIIGDSTYQIEKKEREKLRTIFPEALWDGE